MMTRSKVLKCNLALVIFHFKPLHLGLYPIPWYYWFISIKILHVQAPQLAAVTIDSHPQGSVCDFKVYHWQLSTSPLGVNEKRRQQESSSKEFCIILIIIKCLLCLLYKLYTHIYVIWSDKISFFIYISWLYHSVVLYLF